MMLYSAWLYVSVLSSDALYLLTFAFGLFCRLATAIPQVLTSPSIRRLCM